MSEKTEQFLVWLNINVFMGVLLACLFFWVSSCQRTAIVEACLKNMPEDKKAFCIRDSGDCSIVCLHKPKEPRHE